MSFSLCNFVSEICFVLVRSYSISPLCLQCTVKKTLFLRFFKKNERSILITYLITLSLEKYIIVLEKSVEKVLNCGSKNLYEPCVTEVTFSFSFFITVYYYFFTNQATLKKRSQRNAISTAS